MKRFTYSLSVFVIILFAINVAAAAKIAVMPIGAETKKEKKMAEKIEKKLKKQLSSVSEIVPCPEDAKGKISACETDVDCMKEVVKGLKKLDFIILSKMKFDSDDNTLIKLYLVDPAGEEIETSKAKGEDEDEASKKMTSAIRDLIKNTSGKKKEEAEEEEKPVKKSKKYVAEEPASDSEDSEDLGAGNETINRGLDAYKAGNLKKAEEIFYKGGKKDTTAKKLYTVVKEIGEYIKKIKELRDEKRYDDAILIIDEFQKKDLAIRTLGYKNSVFTQDNVSRIFYEEPSKKDLEVVEGIHKKFIKKLEDARLAKVKDASDIDKALNDKILERETKIKSSVAAEADISKKEKEEEAALKEKIKNLKYSWEKEDGELEQQIVANESKITMLEQKEKGVIKVSTEKRDQEKAKEFDAVDKKYSDLRKKLDAEKETFYGKDKDALNKGGEKTDKQIADLAKSKKEKEEKLKELDKKIQTAMDEADKIEKDHMGGNESVKMKNEDEDRKYNVEVEKEYQVKFDELNKKLMDYDQRDSGKKDEVSKFDKEIEEFMTKKAEEMGKVQETVEKERLAVDTEYKTKKDNSSAEAEKQYKAKLDELTAKKTEIETKTASFDADTEKMKKEKEDAMTAETKKPEEIKKELAKIDTARKAELAKMKKDLPGIEKELQKHEKAHDSFIASAIKNIDADYEKKSGDLDMKLATENQRLQKEIKTFKEAKLAEKKKKEQDYQAFLKDKDTYRKNIDAMVAAAQKDRDAKIAKRKEDRTKLSGTWDKDRESRKAALDRKLDPDRKLKEKLVKEIEEITNNTEKINAKWSKELEDTKVKQNESAEKFEKEWRAKKEALEKEATEKREAVTKKYEQIEVAEKDSNKEKKTKLEQEVEKLNAEKNKRKEKRQAALTEEKEKWNQMKEKWEKEKEKRKKDLEKFKEESDASLKDDKKKAAEKRRKMENKFDEEIKKINDEEAEQIQAKFKDDYKEVSKREIEPSKITMEIDAVKSELLARQGLNNLQKEDLISARRSFVSALYIDKNNQTAKDGMKAITTAAKTIYWKAYGMKESNKSEAKKIFETLIKTLPPSNEYFIKAKTALEEVK